MLEIYHMPDSSLRLLSAFDFIFYHVPCENHQYQGALFNNSLDFWKRLDTKIVKSSVIESATFHNVSRDKTGRSIWSHEPVENSNAIDRFFQGANTSDFGSIIALRYYRWNESFLFAMSHMMACGFVTTMRTYATCVRLLLNMNGHV